MEYINICLILWLLMFGEMNYLFIFISSLPLSCVPSLLPSLSLLCSQGQPFLPSLLPLSIFHILFSTAAEGKWLWTWQREAENLIQSCTLDCESNTHPQTYSTLLFTHFHSSEDLGGPWSVCLVGCISWKGVCVFCVNECVGVLRHFWWDIERCVCHSVSGWAIEGRAPLSSPCSSSSSLCPSSPPHLHSLREPSTSPKTVSTSMISIYTSMWLS